MSLFRLRLRLKAPLGTPLTSGTLFGHLCWARREADGEAALIAWLEALPYRPWALSDAFPADRLPFPMLPSLPPPRPDRMDAEALDKLRKDKKAAKQAWITLDTWKSARRRCNAPIRQALTEGEKKVRDEKTERQESNLAKVRIAHNTIDRRTGSTPEEGGLYFLDEDWSFAADPRRDVYVRADTTEAELRTLFSAVGEAGYGRDATYGRGCFEVEAIDDASWLDDCAGNRMLSLSQGALSPNMREPRYKLFTLFGKVGAGMLADGVRPWKKPLLLTRAGCTFRPEGEGPFGAWLTDVHQDRPEIGHNAFHLTIPYAEGGSDR
jgi:CRISPR-associated protein Csm4